jgi:small ligand-binding sensory domain FIST
MQNPPSVGVARTGSGLSGHLNTVQATGQACVQCADGLAGATADLAMIFFTTHHSAQAEAIGRVVQRMLAPRCTLGVSAESVLGGETEFERVAGVSVLALSLPGVDLKTFRIEDLLPFVGPDSGPDLAAAAGMTGAFRGTILLADPFSVPMNSLLPAIARARPEVGGNDTDLRRRPAPIIGGLASGAEKAGGNRLLLNGAVSRSGGVGVSFSGPVRIDALVSQGCRPIGQPMVITGGKGQIITSLGGKPALRALSEMIESLDEHSKSLLKRGLFIGRAVNEYKDRFGRDDFLIRAVLGVDQNTESLAVAELLKVGQTVQFHVRDSTTASEDLALLLDGQRLHDEPIGALAFTCNGRGTRLFSTPNHDARAISRAFTHPRAAEERAKPGTPIPDTQQPMPLAGFFAAGEIGPIGDGVFVHGQTASVALFRSGHP